MKGKWYWPDWFAKKQRHPGDQEQEIAEGSNGSSKIHDRDCMAVAAQSPHVACGPGTGEDCQ
jgi:hypothetical protein